MKTTAKTLLLIALNLILFTSQQPIWAKDNLKIINYNVLVGMESDSTEHKQLFGKWIKEQNPDIVALEEMNNFTQKSLEQFARGYGHPYTVLLKEEGYPVALTSRTPIVNVSKVIDNMHHGYIQARVGDVNIIVLHLSPFRHVKRNEEIDHLLATIATFPKTEKWMLMGDFNSVSPLDAQHYADGRLAKSMEGGDIKYDYVENLIDGKELDYAVHQKILDAGFVDVLNIYNKGFVTTCETERYMPKAKNEPTSRIDFIYISHNMKPQAVNAYVPQDAFTDYYSDHYPVILELKK